MSGPTLLLLGVAGGGGALTRFLLDGVLTARAGGGLPVGTLAVNLSGALLLGLVTGLALRGAALDIVGTGAIGGYTTFSTWMFESERLGEEGRLALAALNLLASLLLGVGAVALGRWIA